MDKFFVFFFSMKLDPSPTVCTLNEESCKTVDGTSTLYTKYVFQAQPDELMETKPEPFDDIASDEFNRILTVKKGAEEDDEGDNNGLFTQPVPLKLEDEQFPRILFLGTSSADSYLLRNSTGILVHLS